jgi:hypothetical protein
MEVFYLCVIVFSFLPNCAMSAKSQSGREWTNKYTSLANKIQFAFVKQIGQWMAVFEDGKPFNQHEIPTRDDQRSQCDACQRGEKTVFLPCPFGKLRDGEQQEYQAIIPVVAQQESPGIDACSQNRLQAADKS